MYIYTPTSHIRSQHPCTAGARFVPGNAHTLWFYPPRSSFSWMCKFTYAVARVLNESEDVEKSMLGLSCSFNRPPPPPIPLPFSVCVGPLTQHENNRHSVETRHHAGPLPVHVEDPRKVRDEMRQKQTGGGILQHSVLELCHAHAHAQAHTHTRTHVLVVSSLCTPLPSQPATRIGCLAR